LQGPFRHGRTVAGRIGDALIVEIGGKTEVRDGAPMPALHPGEMLLEELLIPLGMAPEMLADAINVPLRRVLAIVKEQRQLDADMCLRLARYFRMSPQFWMNLQKAYELEGAMERWPAVCKEVSMHPKDRRTGALRTPARMQGRVQ
jgi:addiction module HigA family antidote